MWRDAVLLQRRGSILEHCTSMGCRISVCYEEFL
jgi:hypothetical protein